MNNYYQNKYTEKSYNKYIEKAMDLFIQDAIIGHVVHSDKLHQDIGIDRSVITEDDIITIDDKIQDCVILDTKGFTATDKNRIFIEYRRIYTTGSTSQGSFLSDNKRNDYTVIVTSDKYAVIIDRLKFKHILEADLDSYIQKHGKRNNGSLYKFHQKTYRDIENDLDQYEFDAYYLRFSKEDMENLPIKDAISIIKLPTNEKRFLN